MVLAVATINRRWWLVLIILVRGKSVIACPLDVSRANRLNKRQCLALCGTRFPDLNLQPLLLDLILDGVSLRFRKLLACLVV